MTRHHPLETTSDAAYRDGGAHPVAYLGTGRNRSWWQELAAELAAFAAEAQS